MCDCHRTPSSRTGGAAYSTRRERSSGNPPKHDVIVRYVGPTALLLKGPTSRRVYAVTPGMDPIPVDARDARAFLGSPLFRER